MKDEKNTIPHYIDDIWFGLYMCFVRKKNFYDETKSFSIVNKSFVTFSKVDANPLRSQVKGICVTMPTFSFIAITMSNKVSSFTEQIIILVQKILFTHIYLAKKHK